MSLETTTNTSNSNELIKILVSLGTCGIAAGTKPILEAIKNEITQNKLEKSFQIIEVGCMGLCHSEPSIELVGQSSQKHLIYGKVKPDQVKSILEHGLTASPVAKVINRTWYYPEEEENTGNHLQARIVLRNSGRINPEKIEEYLEVGGYEALKKVLKSNNPQAAIDLVKKSGLRGRGGGGFPTGTKWQFAANQKNDQKFMICNADEGDPGAFMDRAVLEGDPHAVLEGMAIGGFATGSSKGIIYIRAEYPLAIQRLEIAIKAASEHRFLGSNILGSGFNFTIEIKYGAGAFVCGEETALIHSIEGYRGEPTPKPPFPAVAGLFGRPTIVNNVETYANLPAIFRQGADWFRKIGTEKSPGTKIFALAGKINDVGLIEVPMGTPLGDVIYKLGNGIPNNKKFKAVQTGGPSGGCLTNDHLKVGLEYDTLIPLGSMMGSGGMIVMDEDDCMVNIAKFFLEFTLDESCGKCTPCRVGNKRLYEMLDLVSQGKATHATITKLKTLSSIIKETSLCGLGQSSPNPILSTIRNFENEYLAHVENHKCPAGVCKELFEFVINANCIGCTVCARNCPVHCIKGAKKEIHLIDQQQCIKCGVCYEKCKLHAIDRV